MEIDRDRMHLNYSAPQRSMLECRLMVHVHAVNYIAVVTLCHYYLHIQQQNKHVT